MKFEVVARGASAVKVSGVDTDGANFFHGFFGGVNADADAADDVGTGGGGSKLSCRQVVTFLAETFSDGRTFCSSAAKISENEVEAEALFDHPDHAGGVGDFG